MSVDGGTAGVIEASTISMPPPSVDRSATPRERGTVKVYAASPRYLSGQVWSVEWSNSDNATAVGTAITLPVVWGRAVIEAIAGWPATIADGQLTVSSPGQTAQIYLLAD